MKFDFDPRKSTANQKKNGIDFVEAQALWEDADRLEVPAKTHGEERYLLIGRIADAHWSAVFTVRDDKARIISVRRSRKQEVEAYES